VDRTVVPRLTVVAVAAAILVVLLRATAHLSPVQPPHVTSPTGALGNSGPAVACTTTVHGVIARTLGRHRLPAEQVPTQFGQSANLEQGTVTYSLKRRASDPPRVAITLSTCRTLTPTVGGMSTASSVRIQGHEGLLETGPPIPPSSAPTEAGRDQPRERRRLQASGSDRAEGSLGHLRFARGAHDSSVSAGRIIDRTKAIAIVRAEFPHLVAVAKLSSWSEVLGLIRRWLWKGVVHSAGGAHCCTLATIWALLLTPRDNNSTQRAPSNDDFVILNAATVQQNSPPGW